MKEPAPQMSNEILAIRTHKKELEKIITGLDANKSMGPDGILG